MKPAQQITKIIKEIPDTMLCVACLT